MSRHLAAAGTTVVLAALGLANASCRLDETPPHVASVVVEMNPRSLYAGDTAHLVAVPLDARGTPLTDRDAEWNSSDSTTVSVTADGLLVARRPGSASVTAVVEGQSGQLLVDVLAPAIHADRDSLLFRATAFDGDPPAQFITVSTSPALDLSVAVRYDGCVPTTEPCAATDGWLAPVIDSSGGGPGRTVIRLRPNVRSVGPARHAATLLITGERGVATSVPVSLVTTRVERVELVIDTALRMTGEVSVATARAFDAAGARPPFASATWSVQPATLARVVRLTDSSAALAADSAGRARVEAVIGGRSTTVDFLVRPAGGPYLLGAPDPQRRFATSFDAVVTTFTPVAVTSVTVSVGDSSAAYTRASCPGSVDTVFTKCWRGAVSLASVAFGQAAAIIVAEDALGGRRTATWSFVKNESPRLQFVDLAPERGDGYTYVKSPVRMRVHCDDDGPGCTISATKQEVPWPASYRAPEGWFAGGADIDTSVVLPAQTRWRMRVIARDALGDSAVVSRLLVVGPGAVVLLRSPSLVSPPTGTIREDSAAIELDALSEPPVSGVSVRLDNSALQGSYDLSYSIGPWSGTCIGAPCWNRLLDVSSVPTGAYSLHFTVTDSAGFQSSADVPVVLDRKPVLTVQSPSGPSAVANALHVEARCTDDVACTQVFVAIEGPPLGPGRPGNEFILASGTTALDAVVDVREYGLGTKHLIFGARDALGLVTQNVYVTVTAP